MRRLIALAAVLVCAHAAAGPSLMVAVSKRVPCLGDTVKLAAYYDNWDAAAPDSTVIFAVECDGRARTLGKAQIARDPAHPFDPSVEWRPDQAGPYRIIARLDPQPGPTAALLVPVTVQPVFFCWYGDTRPEVQWITHHLTAGEPEINALHARGIVALKQVGGVSYFGGARAESIRPDLDPATVAPQILSDYTHVEPWDGIAIDELGMWDAHPQQTQLALAMWDVLKQARAAQPGKFVAAWQFAALTPLECDLLRDTTDLVMCEVYQNHFRAWYDQHTLYEYLRQRIETARNMMVIKQTVIGLAISTDYGGVRPDELEDQIRYIRATGPEMRGVAFFTTSRADPAILKAANDCCYRYWIRPAVGLFSEADLTVSDTQPRHGGTIDIRATLHNVGGSEARSVGVRLWDGDPAAGGKLIGTKVISRLPAARWVDPKSRDDQSIEPPEAMRRDGFGMVTVAVPWKPTAGAHQLWAEVVPSDRYTTIRAFETKRLGVR